MQAIKMIRVDPGVGDPLRCTCETCDGEPLTVGQASWVCPRCGLEYAPRYESGLNVQEGSANCTYNKSKTVSYGEVESSPRHVIPPPPTIVNKTLLFQDFRGRVLCVSTQAIFFRLNKTCLQTSPPQQRRLLQLSMAIGDVVRLLGIDANTWSRAVYLYKAVIRKDPRLDKVNPYVVAAACMYLATKETKRHVSPHVIIETFTRVGHKVSIHQLMRCQEHSARLVQIKRGKKDMEEFVSRVEQSIGANVPTHEIPAYMNSLRASIRALDERVVCQPAKAGAAAAALIYAADKLAGNHLTQQAVAEACDVTDITLRKYFRLYKPHVQALGGKCA